MISIAMPTFKQHNFIEESIYSILDQSYKDIELVIVPVDRDNRTIDIIRSIKDSRIKMIVSNYASITHQMNLGALSSSGEYFMYFASDDFLLPDSLKLLHDIAVKKNASVVYPNFYVGDKKLRTKSTYKAVAHSLKGIREACYITDVSFCKSKHFMKYIPMKFSSRKNRIWDVWKAMSENKKYKIVNCKTPTFIYRQHGKNVHKREDSQKNYSFSVDGDNDNLEKFYNKIPRVKDKLKKDNYSIYFPNPSVFVDNKSMYKYKRITLHWDESNINLMDEVVDLKCVYNVTHDSGILDILKEKGMSNVCFVKSGDDLIDYLTEEKY